MPHRRLLSRVPGLHRPSRNRPDDTEAEGQGAVAAPADHGAAAGDARGSLAYRHATQAATILLAARDRLSAPFSRLQCFFAGQVPQLCARRPTADRVALAAAADASKCVFLRQNCSTWCSAWVPTNHRHDSVGVCACRVGSYQPDADGTAPSGSCICRCRERGICG